MSSRVAICHHPGAETRPHPFFAETLKLETT